LKGLAPILRRLGQNRKSAMKVASLKNIPKVSAPSAAEPTDGYSGPVPAMRESQRLRRNPENGRKRRVAAYG
jgi:hypothetical protein